MNPKVTVVVASYNNARYLPTCLDSLLHQTFSDFEVLVVDDCSTDNSFDICQKYSKRDARFRIIRTEKNQGVTYVKHLGLKEARGEYVAVLDSDDIALPDRLARQVTWLDSHPETVLVAGYYGIVDSAEKIKKRKKKVPLDDTSIRWWLTFGNCLIHSTVMYRREQALACGGHDISFIHGEDIDLISKLMGLGRLEAIPVVVSYWRTHQSSVTKYVASEEREKYYVTLVQRSIQIHTQQTVDRDVAAAAFYNTKTVAKNKTEFQSAVQVIIRAFDFYLDSKQNNIHQKKLLARCFIKHLSRLRKRNRKEVWWNDGKIAWRNALKFLLKERNYPWYLDFKLFVPGTHIEWEDLLTLVRISLPGK